MECVDTTELFNGDLTMHYPYDDSDDFANAPTPFMTPLVDLNDIDVQPFDGMDCAAIDGNNNSMIDFGGIFSDHEVVVDDSVAVVAPPLVAHQLAIKSEPMTDYEVSGAVESVSRAGRKRHISYENTYEDEEEDNSGDETTDDESMAAESVTSKGKAKVGRKPAKGGKKCMSRNAIAARENREKKKRESEDMKRRLTTAETENRSMRSTIDRLTREKQEINAENAYLRSVLANQSSIAALIKHISNAPKVELIGTHFVAATTDGHQMPVKASADDKNQRKSNRIAARVDSNGGICVHVNNNKLSLELCHKCSESAVAAKRPKKAK